MTTEEDMKRIDPRAPIVNESESAEERARRFQREAEEKLKASEQWAWWKGLTPTQRFWGGAAIIIVAIIILAVVL